MQEMLHLQAAEAQRSESGQLLHEVSSFLLLLGEKRSPQGALCLPPPLSWGHGADVGRALGVAAAAEGITLVGRGPAEVL